MQSRGFRQSGWIVTTFQQTDDPAAGVHCCSVQHGLRQSFKVLGFQPQRADRVFGVSIEAGAENNQFRSDAIHGSIEDGLEVAQELTSGSTERDREIECCSQPVSGTDFITATGARVKGKPM